MWGSQQNQWKRLASVIKNRVNGNDHIEPKERVVK